MKKYISIFVLVAFSLLMNSCHSVKYSMTGASITPGMKTVSVQLFPNRALIIQPILSQQFTEALKEKMRSQTSLIMINDVGDANFEGEITDYNAQPMAITANDQASKNRLTISVRVKYTNSLDPQLSFDTKFSRYKDYASDQSIDQVEATLIPEIIELLTEDIYNKAFVNW